VLSVIMIGKLIS